MKIPWACPKCGAKAREHGRGGEDACDARLRGCNGFICECEYSADDMGHGLSFADRCESAVCYHCGWSGIFPPRPRGLVLWEKRALEAGWTPPKSRQAELQRQLAKKEKT